MKRIKPAPTRPACRINDLSAEFDALLSRMRGPAARKAMNAAYHASPKQLGRAAVAAIQKRVQIQHARSVLMLHMQHHYVVIAT